MIIQILNNQKDFNLLDIISVIVNTLIGLMAIFSFWISVKALRKSEVDSNMNTCATLVVRPESRWIGDGLEGKGYSVIDSGRKIDKQSVVDELAICIDFECFNAGRGVAFNISNVISNGMKISYNGYRVPLYLSLTDEPFKIRLLLSNTFDYFYNITDQKIPVSLSISYTNDQNNVFCKTLWSANIKPFDKNDDKLVVREDIIIDRTSKVEYLTKKNGKNK